MKTFKNFAAVTAAALTVMGAVPAYSIAAESTPIASVTTISPACTYLDGKMTSNSGKNDYTWWADPVCANLAEENDGSLTRVEYIEGKVYIERYKGKKIISSNAITAELDRFGGFYSGQTANYLVYGQSNLYQNNDTEVVRVVKYTKNWERIGSASLYGSNTYEPFEMGSLRMTEASGRLYLYTCHKMYRHTDGENHQANMTIVVDENKLKVVDSYTRVYDVTEGYVSHSFNQLIATDGNKIFRMDQGDSYPRGIYISRCNVGDEVKRVAYDTIMKFSGEIGNNATGASLGGLELSSDRCVIAGNSVDQNAGNVNFHGQRNIFITTVNKENFGDRNFRYITNYANDADVTVKTPHIVKSGDNSFVIMWEEFHRDIDQWLTKYTTCNENGELTSDIRTIRAALSDCKPIKCRDGVIRWYVGDGETLRLYGVDPDDLNKFDGSDPYVEETILLGDANLSGGVDSSDASLVLAEYARLSTGEKGTFTDAQIAAADINKDNAINSDDASSILAFYAYTSTGGEYKFMEDWLNGKNKK